MSETSQSQILESWISSFCSMTGHEYFAEVSEDFIEDDFNLTGLSSQVPHYKEALEIILDVEPADDEEEEEDEEALEDLSDDDEIALARSRSARVSSHQVEVETAAELLYGLIHQRYITSRLGISQMHEKYEMGHFGHCPRVYCNLAKVLPVGCSDMPGTETVKLFCPACLDVYTPPNSRFQSVDGAFFGTTFGCLFLMTYPDLQIAGLRAGSDAEDASVASLDDDGKPVAAATASASAAPPYQPPPPEPNPHFPLEMNGVAAAQFAPGLGWRSLYEPRVYGFRVAEQSRTGPRMRWLRSKPDDLRDLDEVAIFTAEDLEDDDLTTSLEGQEDPEGAPTGSKTDPAARKKAPLRRRRAVSAEENGGLGAGINGIG